MKRITCQNCKAVNLVPDNPPAGTKYRCHRCAADLKPEVDPTALVVSAGGGAMLGAAFGPVGAVIGGTIGLLASLISQQE